MEGMGHRPQVLQGVPGIQPLPCSRKPVPYQVPDPDCRIGDNQHLLGLAQPMAHRLSPQLLPERIDTSSCHYCSPTQNERASTLGLHSLAQTKTGAAIDPVPPFRFLALLAQLLGLPPLLIVAFPNVPSIQFNHQSERFHWLLLPQFWHLLLQAGPLSHLLVHLLAFALSPFALASSFPVQSCPRQLHSGQPLDHSAGFGHRQLANRQGGHLLHSRRTSPSLSQSQKVIGGKLPTLAPATPTPRSPDGHHSKAGLVTSLLPVCHSAQLVPTDRADRRCLISLLLCRLL